VVGRKARNTGHKALRARAVLDLADALGWDRAHGVYYMGVPDMAIGPLYYSLYDAACVTISAEFSCDLPWWPQGFETRQSAYQRAVRVRDSLLKRYGQTSETILIVTHADPLGHLIEAFTRVEPNPEYPPWSDNCAITHLRIDNVDAPATVLTQNDTTHLAALPASPQGTR